MKTIVAICLFFLFFSCTNQQVTDKTATFFDSSSNAQKESSVTDSTITDSVRETMIEQLVLRKKYNIALSQVNVLLKKDSTNPGWLFIKADVLEKAADTSTAIQFYKKAIEAAGVFLNAEMRVAHLYAQTGNVKTIKLCDDLLKTEDAVRMRSDILLMKGIYYAKTLNYSKAITLYDQIIQEDYSYVDAYIEKGLTYYDQSKFTEAHKVFFKSTEVSNTFADGYFWMAKTEEKINKKEDAINNYKRALALDQKNEEARDALKRLGVL